MVTVEPSGALTVSDVDSAQTFVAQAGTAGSYGTFAIDASGHWSYTMDSAHDELRAGQVVTDTFTVVSADGTTKPAALTWWKPRFDMASASHRRSCAS
mgnify:CR=1 FL=1